MADHGRARLSVLALHEAGQHMHALFFSHLVIEKMLKAHWAKDNEESEPPRIHDLEYLYNQTELKLSANQVDLLGVMNSWKSGETLSRLQRQILQAHHSGLHRRKIEIGRYVETMFTIRIAKQIVGKLTEDLRENGYAPTRAICLDR